MCDARPSLPDSGSEVPSRTYTNQHGQEATQCRPSRRVRPQHPAHPRLRRQPLSIARYLDALTVAWALLAMPVAPRARPRRADDACLSTLAYVRPIGKTHKPRRVQSWRVRMPRAVVRCRCPTRSRSGRLRLPGGAVTCALSCSWGGLQLLTERGCGGPGLGASSAIHRRTGADCVQWETCHGGNLSARCNAITSPARYAAIASAVILPACSVLLRRWIVAMVFYLPGGLPGFSGGSTSKLSCLNALSIAARESRSAATAGFGFSCW